MEKKTLRENTVFIMWEFIWNFFVSLFESARLFILALLGKKKINAPSNPFFDLMDFILQSGPRNFWKKPTAIKIGRSIATLIQYAFYRKKSYTEKK